MKEKRLEVKADDGVERWPYQALSSNCGNRQIIADFSYAAEFHLGRSRLVFERNYFPPVSFCISM